MRRAATLLSFVLLASLAPAAAGQASEKAVAKGVAAATKSGLTTFGSRLAASGKALLAELAAVELEAKQDGVDNELVGDLFAALALFQQDVVDAEHDLIEDVVADVQLVLQEAGAERSGSGGAEGDTGIPSVLQPGTGSRLDALRDAAGRLVDKRYRKLATRVLKTVRKLEKTTGRALAVRLEPPLWSAEATISATSALFETAHIGIDVALAAAPHEAQDAVLFAGGSGVGIFGNVNVTLFGTDADSAGATATLTGFRWATAVPDIDAAGQDAYILFASQGGPPATLALAVP